MFLLTYYSQTDSSFEAINWVMKVILHHWLTTLKQFIKWFIVLLYLQIVLNNSIKYSSMNLSLNQILFKFWTQKTLDLICVNESEVIESVYSVISVSIMHLSVESDAVKLITLNINSIFKSSASASEKQKYIKLVAVNQYRLTHIDVKDVIAFVIMQMKHYYNQNHMTHFF